MSGKQSPYKQAVWIPELINALAVSVPSPTPTRLLCSIHHYGTGYHSGLRRCVRTSKHTLLIYWSVCEGRKWTNTLKRITTGNSALLALWSLLGGWLLVSKVLHTLIVPPHLHYCQHALVSAAIPHNLTGLFSASEDNQVCSFNPIRTGWGCTGGATSLCSENGPLIRQRLWPFQEASLTKSRESLRGTNDAVVKQVINGCRHTWRRRNMKQFSLFYFMASWSENTVYQKSYQAWSGQVAILSEKDKQPQPPICTSVTNKRGLQNLTEMLQGSGNTLVFEQAILIGRL